MFHLSGTKRIKAERFLLILLALVSVAACAAADQFQLPSGLRTVGEEAFTGIAPIREITLPSGWETDFCSTFPTVEETVWVHSEPGELAHSLLNAGVDVEAGSVFRALAICQTYLNSGSNTLWGPANDAAAMKAMLTHLDRMGYEVTIQRDLSVGEILLAIQNVFSGADVYDVSLFCYSGHGARGGTLVGCEDGEMSGELPPSALREVLDQIPGRKVILIDACFSGGMLEEEWMKDTEETEPEVSIQNSGSQNLTFHSASQTEPPEDSEQTEKMDNFSPGDFNADFLSAFSSAAPGTGLRRRNEGTYSAYYVMTAAAASQESFEKMFFESGGSVQMGLFTYYLCLGCGWNPAIRTRTEKAADVNGDGLVTFGEAFTYAAQRAAKTAEEGGQNQNAQSNAPDLQSFSPFR